MNQEHIKNIMNMEHKTLDLIDIIFFDYSLRVDHMHIERKIEIILYHLK